MKMALKILAAASVLGMMGWQQWQIQRHTKNIESLTSHFNAIEEGVVFEVEFSELSESLSEAREQSSIMSKDLGKLAGICSNQLERVQALEARMEAVFSAHDDLVRMHNFVAKRVKSVEDEIAESARQQRLLTR